MSESMSEETMKRGDLATTTSGTVTNKEPRARRSMSKCSVRERERRDDEER
jgi:hypothetical protein